MSEPGTAPANSAAPSGERRQVTALFADMAGFTSISERLGEEGTFALIQPIYALMTSAVREHGGSVQDFTGDEIMALFGVPDAVEDAPLRACRTGLAIHERLAATAPAIEARHGVRPQMRVGVNSELVVVTQIRGESGPLTALGDPVNLASRLQTLAGPGTVYLSEATQRLVQGLVETTFVGAHVIKGKAEPQKGRRSGAKIGLPRRGTKAEGNSRSTDQRRDVHLGRPGRGRCADRHRERHRAVNAARRSFLRELSISRVAALDRRIGHTHSEHGVTAMPELLLQDQGFEIAHRWAHAPIALAKRDKHRVQHLLGKAGLRQPRPQVRPVPEIEGDLRHPVILKNFFQALGDKFIADRRAGRRFEIAPRGPHIIGRMVAGRLFRQTIGRQPEDRPHMPLAVSGHSAPRQARSDRRFRKDRGRQTRSAP